MAISMENSSRYGLRYRVQVGRNGKMHEGGRHKTAKDAMRAEAEVNYRLAWMELDGLPMFSPWRAK